MKTRTVTIGIYLSLLHFMLGTVLLVYLLRKDFGIASSNAASDSLDSFLSPVVDVMWQPGLDLWTQHLVSYLPHIFSWILMALNSALWGFGLALLIAAISYGKELLTSRLRPTR